MLVEELGARPLEPLAPGSVRLVPDRRDEQAKTDLVPVDVSREARLQARDLLDLGPGGSLETAFAGEAPQLDPAARAVLGGGAQALAGVERREVGVALVDRSELELVLVPGEVEVELLVECADEPFGLLAIRLEIGRGARHEPRIAGVPEFEIRTERKTELVDMTADVRTALAEVGDAAAALVYVPHTTAGVTINEHIDPALKEDIEMALEKLVADEWGWRHHDADGPNAPSHIRASLISPQVLVPLRDGELALGRYQGIFFCEFDGPRRRKVYVSTLR